MTNPVILDDAIEAAARTLEPAAWELTGDVAAQVRRNHRNTSLQMLTAAAPLIVAANQPEPNDDLRETLNARLRKGLPSPPPHVGGWALPSDRRAALVDALAPVVEAYVAAQATAARADERRTLTADPDRAERAAGFFREFFEVGGNGEGWNTTHVLCVAMWLAGVEMTPHAVRMAEQVIGPLEATDG